MSQGLEQSPEILQVQQWRFLQAREAGLTKIEARLWAESDRDIGELRRLVVLGTTPQMIARIVL